MKVNQQKIIFDKKWFPPKPYPSARMEYGEPPISELSLILYTAGDSAPAYGSYGIISSSSKRKLPINYQ